MSFILLSVHNFILSFLGLMTGSKAKNNSSKGKAQYAEIKQSAADRNKRLANMKG